jgi:hypothetical protein
MNNTMNSNSNSNSNSNTRKRLVDTSTSKVKYTGTPCTKCPKDSKAAFSHPTDKHRDDYKPFKKFKSTK